jgi:hypothetical protein
MTAHQKLTPQSAQDVTAIVRWYDAPKAQALLASIKARPPLAETRFATYAITRDEWSEYVGGRVDALRGIYARFGDELMQLCHAAYMDFGPDAPQSAIDEAYAPFVAYAAEPVDLVIDGVLGRVS